MDPVYYCYWTPAHEFDSSYWMTDCSHTFEFIEGDPEENNFAFCPYCGGKLIEEEGAAVYSKQDDEAWEEDR